MARRSWRAFLDTSALIAGLLSPTGSAHEVLRLFEIGVVELIVSRQVLVEADRNLTAKMSMLLDAYHEFLRRLNPEVVEDPSREAISQARQVIHHADAPILAAAIESRVDYIITWNTRHFHKKPVQDFVSFPIVTPAEFLTAFRRAILEE
ncbi:MAG: PIN domain-containing protein [Nitrospira sp.]|nr:PIN domain-containing protein [Nitrospira sp.]